MQHSEVSQLSRGGQQTGTDGAGVTDSQPAAPPPAPPPSAPAPSRASQHDHMWYELRKPSLDTCCFLTGCKQSTRSDVRLFATKKPPREPSDACVVLQASEESCGGPFVKGEANQPVMLKLGQWLPRSLALACGCKSNGAQRRGLLEM